VGVSRAASSLAASDFQRNRRELVTKGLNGSKGLGVRALYRTITAVRSMFKRAGTTRRSAGRSVFQVLFALVVHRPRVKSGTSTGRLRAATERSVKALMTLHAAAS
jgi:hypothetical protein